VSPDFFTEPAATLPVSSTERSGEALLARSLEGDVASVAALKLVVQRPAAGAPARPPLYHMELNHWIEFVDKDHVRYHAYYLTVSGALGQETPARIVAAGQSLDTMERVSGKWLLKTRDVAAKD